MSIQSVPGQFHMRSAETAVIAQAYQYIAKL